MIKINDIKMENQFPLVHVDRSCWVRLACGDLAYIHFANTFWNNREDHRFLPVLVFSHGEAGPALELIHKDEIVTVLNKNPDIQVTFR